MEGTFMCARVNWPSACVGCGENDRSKLTEGYFDYKFSENIGGGRARIYEIGVSSFLCSPCESDAKKKLFIILGIFSTLSIIFLILFFVTFFPGFIPFSLFSAVFLLMWWVRNRHYPKAFFKIKVKRGGFTFHLKNPTYGKIFKSVNGGLFVKLGKRMPKRN